MPSSNFLACLVSEISAFIWSDRQTDGRIDGQTDLARSTRSVMLLKNIYSL